MNISHRSEIQRTRLDHWINVASSARKDNYFVYYCQNQIDLINKLTIVYERITLVIENQVKSSTLE